MKISGYSVSAPFFPVLGLKCMVSSTIEFYLQVWGKGCTWEELEGREGGVEMMEIQCSCRKFSNSNNKIILKIEMEIKK